ncbi:MAG: hypothetical protein WCK67_07390 [bacterium]
MNINRSKILLGVAVGFIFGTLPVFAYEGAILSEIEINPYNESNYQFILKTDKKIPIQKIISSDNKVILKLKHTRPAKFVNTVYNTSSVDNIIIQPSSDDEVKIYIEGMNAAQSYISLETADNGLDFMPPVQTAATDTQPPIAKASVVNTSQKAVPTNTNIKAAPTSTPVNVEPKNLNEQIPENVVQVNNKPDFKPAIVMPEATSEEKNNIKQTEGGSHLGLLKKIFGSSLIDNIIRGLALLVIMLGAFKFLKPREKQVKINLNSNHNIKDREADLFKQLNNSRGLIGSSLKSSYDKQTPLKRNTSSVNYGLKEYQNSQVAPKSMGLKSPPRFSAEDIGFKPSLSHDVSLGLNRTKKASINTQTRQPASRVTQNDINSAKVNIDNVKFLETMAGIYEKSGRTDLASGIQSSLRKTNR